MPYSAHKEAAASNLLLSRYQNMQMNDENDAGGMCPRDAINLARCACWGAMGIHFGHVDCHKTIRMLSNAARGAVGRDTAVFLIGV